MFSSNRKLSLLFLFIVFPLFLFQNSAVAEIITSDILQRVFLIKYKDSTGSSFAVDVDNKQYLITAKHLAQGIQDKDEIELMHDNKWIKVSVKIIFCKNPNVDIVVLVLPHPIVIQAHPIELTTKNIAISQEVFFLGFPFMMYTDAGAQNTYYPIPFVKKGILSSIGVNNKAGEILYIDGNNNPGFSGGPIVFYDLQSKELKVAGVISGYRIQYDKVVQADLAAEANSGILIGYAIDSAIEAIREKPIGSDIK